MTQYIFTLSLGITAAACLTEIILRLNVVSWRTHPAVFVGLHVGMAAQCTITLFNIAFDPSGGSVGDFVSVASVAVWIYSSIGDCRLAGYVHQQPQSSNGKLP